MRTYWECDRCGKHFEDTKYHPFLLHTEPPKGRAITFSFCEACQSIVLDFLQLSDKGKLPDYKAQALEAKRELRNLARRYTTASAAIDRLLRGLSKTREDVARLTSEVAAAQAKEAERWQEQHQEDYAELQRARAAVQGIDERARLWDAERLTFNNLIEAISPITRTPESDPIRRHVDVPYITSLIKDLGTYAQRARAALGSKEIVDG